MSKPQCCPTILHRVVAHVLAFENNQIMIWKSVISFLSVNMGSVSMDLVPTVGNEGEQKTLIGLTNRQVVLRGCRKHAIMTCTQTVTTVTISSLIHKGSRIETIITIPESSTMGHTYPKNQTTQSGMDGVFSTRPIHSVQDLLHWANSGFWAESQLFFLGILYCPFSQKHSMHQNASTFQHVYTLLSRKTVVSGFIQKPSWGFPKMGIPLVIIHFTGIFPYKPSSYWCTPLKRLIRGPWFPIGSHAELTPMGLDQRPGDGEIAAYEWLKSLDGGRGSLFEGPGDPGVPFGRGCHGHGSTPKWLMLKWEMLLQIAGVD